MQKLNFLKLIKKFLALGLALSLLSGCKGNNTAEQQGVPPTPITTTTVKWQRTNIKFDSVGFISSQQSPILRAQVPGNIDRIAVQIGDAVKVGQVLISLHQKDEFIQFRQAQAKLIQAQARYAQVVSVAQRKAILASRGIVSQMENSEAITSQKVAQADVDVAQYSLQDAKIELEKTNILSPINGFVQAISVSVGDKVDVGTALLQLINPNKLRVILPFAEQEALYFTIGQAVRLTSVANPNQVLMAKVTSITPNIDAKNLAIKVIVDFDNTQNWKSGESVHGYVVALKDFKALVIPENCIVMRPQGRVVFVIKNNKAIAHLIQTGYSENGYVMVLKGLKAGDLIAQDGVDYLNDGAPVKVVNQAP